AKNNAVDPLVQDGKRLIPSVTRVFSTGHEIYVSFQAYKPPPTATPPVPDTQPLFAFVTLYQGGKKMYETPPESIVPSATSRLGTMRLNFDLSVDSLPRGSYDCQVTVIDPSTQKAAFWRASITLVP
ncbi:MAG: VWA domain-containing protein, partial [Terracidiphilus sp.]